MTTVNEEGKALVEQSTFDKGKALAEFMEYIQIGRASCRERVSSPV